MNKSISPLRYPGGKLKVYHELVELLMKNNKLGSTYVEPFAGGCGLALALLKNEKVSNLILNDIDRGIYSFWKSILLYNNEFCKMVENADISIQERDIQKQVQKNKENIDLRKKRDVLSLGFSTFYLNRVNRSGIIKGGVIGGNKQTGNYKMDCRFNKKRLIEQIKEVGFLKNKIKFYNLDAIRFLKKLEKLENIFIFFDPPYYEKGKDLYTNFYNHHDHVRLAKHIFRLNADWIVTYDNVESIKEIYKEYRNKEFEITYTLANKRIAKEIVIYSNTLKILL